MMNRFSIPGLIRYIALFNALVFILHLLAPGYLSVLELDPRLILSGQFWRLVTWIFIPETLSPFWIFFALLFLLYIGDGLEAEMGAERLTRFYACGVLLCTVVNLAFGLLGGGSAVGRANTFLNISLLLAFATLYPGFKVLVFFILPVRVVWLAAFSAGLMILGSLGQPPVVAATLGAAFLNYFLFFRRDIPALFGKGTLPLPSRITNLKSSTAKGVREPSSPLHRCTTCGRTEATHPELDFRVSSNGEEYCTEHLPGKSPATP
jgi:membrane associated rhomboid family serine protease